MSTYLMLMNLTPEGRRRMLAVPDTLMNAEKDLDVPGAKIMGTYATLGQYDFVAILDAPGNDEAANVSMKMGVAAGMQITTLPAIPIGRFEVDLTKSDSLEQTAGDPFPSSGGTPEYENAPS